jgi:predicted 2-oxoglutarate/Fe(II)-dependent dioxygenase YbiX
MRGQVKAHPAKAQAVDPSQLVIGNARGRQGDALIGTALFRERVLEHPVVHPVHRGLHDDAAPSSASIPRYRAVLSILLFAGNPSDYAGANNVENGYSTARIVATAMLLAYGWSA